MKILLVDDEPWSIQGLIASLESRGMECVVATNMAAGIKELQYRDISAVVTDVMMPPDQSSSKVDSSETGFHFIEHIKEHWPGLPIVCLSVIADSAKIRFLTKRGVRYLRKGETPLSTAVEVITAVAEGRRVKPKR